MRSKFSIFISKPSIKEKIKKFIFKKNSDGPNSLIENLIIGLKKNNINFSINPKKIQKDQICWVINDKKILKKLIKIKEDLNFHLFAGPNITTLPTDNEKLLLNQKIDKVIVPSDWVKKLYEASSSSKLKKKILTWAVGVNEKYWIKKNVTKKYDYLIYIKDNFKNNIVEKCIRILIKKNYTFRIINYGNYNKKDYLKLLNYSKKLVFFSKSESQGIALFESWSVDVPTLVYQNIKKFDNKLNVYDHQAPFLCKFNGAMFKNINEFGKLISMKEKNLLKNVSPRKWVLKNYTQKISSKKIFKQLFYHANKKTI